MHYIFVNDIKIPSCFPLVDCLVVEQINLNKSVQCVTQTLVIGQTSAATISLWCQVTLMATACMVDHPIIQT